MLMPSFACRCSRYLPFERRRATTLCSVACLLLGAWLVPASGAAAQGSTSSPQGAEVERDDLACVAARQDSDPAVRREAARACSDQAVLMSVAVDDPDPDVKQVALAGITGDEALARALSQIASEQMTYGRRPPAARAARRPPRDPPHQARLYRVVGGALKRIGDQDVITSLAIEASHPRLALDAAKLVKSDTHLVQIALRSRHELAAQHAARNIQDPKERVALVLGDASPEVKASAVAGIRDQDTLLRLAQSVKPSLARTAAARLRDEELLVQLARSEAHLHVRFAAVERIRSTERLRSLVEEAEDDWIRFRAARKLRDEELLFRLAAGASATEAIRQAVRTIKSPGHLQLLVHEAQDERVRVWAAIQVGDEGALARLAAQATTPKTTQEALSGIRDRARLRGLMRPPHPGRLREAARQRLAEVLREATREDDAIQLAERSRPVYAESTRQDALRRLRERALPEDFGELEGYGSLEKEADVREVALRHPDGRMRAAAARLLTVQSDLFQIASKDPDPLVRAAAAGTLVDQSLLAKVTRSEAEGSVRVAAVTRLTRQDELARIVREDRDPRVRLAAVENLRDPDLIAEVARSDADADVRAAASRKLEQ